MLKVIYLKPTWDTYPGTIKEMRYQDANLMIALGICKIFEDEKTIPEEPKKRGRKAKAAV